MPRAVSCNISSSALALDTLTLELRVKNASEMLQRGE